jgi:ABC-type transporter Mla subunit MlaD
MNTHKTVRAALFSEPKKVELSAEKVELNMIGDFKSYLDAVENMDKVLQKTLSDADKTWRKLQTINQEAADAYAKLSNNTSDAESMVKEIEKKFQVVVKAAKSLGIDPNQIPELKKAVKIVENMEDNINQSNQILPDLK